MSLQIEQWGLVPYGLVHDRQMQLVERLQRDASADDVCVMVQHPAVFTLGRNGSPENVTVSRSFLRMRNIELIRVERGGGDHLSWPWPVGMLSHYSSAPQSLACGGIYRSP